MSRLHKIAVALALAVAFLAIPTASFAGLFVNVSVNFGPPAIPVYVQPAVPAPDLIWTPGYWAYGPYGYYWVPGTWVQAPEVGYVWTPGYWAFDGNQYVWNDGYWGTQVGYYGGIDYGFGYFGNGYYGGGWRGDHFRYNTAYTNVNRSVIQFVYVSRPVANNFATGNRVSFNGRGGINVRPSASQVVFAHEHHVGVTSVQRAHIQVAAANRNFLAKVNHGRPTNVAFAAPLGTTHRPANFAPITAVHRTTITTHKTVTTFHAPVTSHTVTTSHAPVTHKTVTTFHAPVTSRTVTTSHAPVIHKTVTTFHAPVTSHTVTTSHAQTTFHSTSTFHAPVTNHSQATMFHAPPQSHTMVRSNVHAGPPAHGAPVQPHPSTQDKEKH